MKRYWFVGGMRRRFLTLDKALEAARRRYPEASWSQTPHQYRGCAGPRIFGSWGDQDENLVIVEFRYP